jgi:alpha-glucosidase (family GH31 glycosyl hydrolase)
MLRVGRTLGAALALSLLAHAAAAPAPAAADDRVSAGALSVDIQTSPWRLTFRDTRGTVLQDHRQGGLSFTANGASYSATRATSTQRQGDAFTATLATTDPLGRTIAVRIRPDGQGAIAVSATVRGGPASRATAAFAAQPNERFLGFGERSNAVDQRGNVVENFVTDGPYLPEERTAVSAFVPSAGYSPRDDATYFPIPWTLSTRGYGFLVDSNENSYFDLASTRADAWTTEVNAGAISYRVFAGPLPHQALRRMTDRLGRQPRAAAPFYFGPWWQPKDGDDANLKALRDADAPTSVVQTYTHYLPCGDHVGKEQAEQARVRKFHDAGLAVTTYFNPMICQGEHPAFDEAASRGLLTKNALGMPYLYRYTGSEQFLVGQFDFTNPQAIDFYGRLLAEAVGHGHDGWMEDFGEYTPRDGRGADGLTGEAAHNLYVTRYHCAAHSFQRRASKPLARFNRSGWTGTARCAQLVWGGDPTTDWGYDGLRSSIRQGLTMGLSGVSLWGSDIGGFFALARDQTDPELLKRWIQFGAVSGVMRTQANGFALGPKRRRAQIFDADVMPVWRRYAKLRTQLYPYLAAADDEYGRSGLPIMRQLALAYPSDPRATIRDDEFLFGRDLLAAPVIEPGAKTRRLYAPAGRWVDLWRSAAYVKRDGSLRLRRARQLRGGREHTLPAPLDELPLLVRAGAVIPMLPPDVDTLAPYGGDRVVNLSDRRRRMRLLAFPRGRTKSRIGPQHLRSVAAKRRWTLTIARGPRRRYDLQASTATLRRPLRVCRVTLNGRPLRRRAWRYDARNRVLRARFTARRAKLVAVSRCGARLP